MYNDLFTIGPFTAHGYGLMIGIGVIAAYFSGVYRGRKYGVDDEPIFTLLIWCLVFGYAASKILYVITIFDQVIRDPRVLLDAITNGWVVYGGILGGILGAWLYLKRRGKNFMQYFDLLMPSVVLAQAFGRIGCFLAGCCYGIACDAPFAVTFHNSGYAPNNIPLFPSQLVMSAFDFALYFFLLWLYRRWHRKVRDVSLKELFSDEAPAAVTADSTEMEEESEEPEAGPVMPDGSVGVIYLACYGVGRFFMEYLRGDLERGNVGFLSISQFIAVFVVLFTVIWFMIRKRHA